VTSWHAGIGVLLVQMTIGRAVMFGLAGLLLRRGNHLLADLIQREAAIAILL
jgi:hypothetical protein